MAVSRHACCSRCSLCVCGCQSLRICLVEDSLEHLLLFWVQDLRQVLIKLRLLLLEACRETSVEFFGYNSQKVAHTQQDMLEQAVRLNLIQWRLKKAFLVKLVIIIFAATKRSEFRSLEQMSAKMSRTRRIKSINQPLGSGIQCMRHPRREHPHQVLLRPHPPSTQSHHPSRYPHLHHHLHPHR